MPPTDPPPKGPNDPDPDDDNPDDGRLSRTKSAEDELLERVRSTSRRIVERVQRALGDTSADHPALPPETDTGDHPPPAT